MAALKRAYADIILNTAKEAATRILVSERKSLRFQQELFAAKEEALNMLLRLKQVMDSKIAEVERECLCQKRKVQELEVHLNKAEETVKDLRTELKIVHDELESMKNNLAKPMDEETAKCHCDVRDNACRGKKMYTYDSIMCGLVSRPKLVSTFDSRDTSQNWSSADDCRRMPPFEDATTHTEPSNAASPSKDYCASNPDLPSIIMRSKEPAESYKNGFTQRIHASEQNLLSGKLPPPGQTNDRCESVVGEDGTAKKICTVDSPKVENAEVLVENSTGSKEMVQHDSSSDRGRVVTFFRRSSLRKQRSRCNQIEATTTWGTLPAQVMENRELSNVYSCSESSPCSQGNATEFEANLSSMTREEAHNGFDSHFAPEDSKNSQNRSDGEIIVTGSVENATDKLKLLTEESLLTRQDSKVADASDVSVCKVNLETVDVPLMNSDLKDEKLCKIVGAPTQAANDRLLKYTFRRKRKREPLGIHKDEIVIEKKNPSKRRTADKRTAVLETQKPTQVMGSSRDSRRLVQVARQLISLSGKRW
ncbi:uncharacterized protein LOC131237362 isoform X2 [Magnolia sinica]|nr:uncharacterized protein LOC131237362 isoform X2 [Magnolia sinica]